MTMKKTIIASSIIASILPHLLLWRLKNILQASLSKLTIWKLLLFIYNRLIWSRVGWVYLRQS